MGATLHLGIDNEFPSDGDYDGKAFYGEIFGEYPGYFKLKDCLTNEEADLIHPSVDDGTDSLEGYKRFDPSVLKSIFLKIFKHLKENTEKFPVVHMIHQKGDKQLGTSTSENFLFKGYKCYLDGYHNDAEHRSELLLNIWKGDDQLQEWIPIESTITLENQTFKVRSQTKFEQFRNNLEELIGVCDDAISSNEKLLWIVSF